MFFRKDRDKKEHALFLHGQSIEYKLVRSRRRSLGMQIDPNGLLIIRAPQQMRWNDIERLVRSKENWIADKLRYFEEAKREMGKLDPSWPVLGKLYPLNFTPTSNLGIHNDCFNVPEHLQIEDRFIQLQKWNDSHARNIIPEIFESEWRKAQLVYPPLQKFSPELRFRRMKRSWGNCRGECITLSTELYKYPQELIEYVICHELAHLIHKDHGIGFYQLQETLFPRWRSAKLQLKELSIKYGQLAQSSQPKVV